MIEILESESIDNLLSNKDIDVIEELRESARKKSLENEEMREKI